MRLRAWPHSLAGQMALLVAIALFVAQSINFALLLHERQTLRLEQATGPTVARLSDAIERTTQGRGPVADRGRVRRKPGNPIKPGDEREPSVEAALRAGLAAGGIRVGTIAVAVRAISADSPILQQMPPERRAMIMRNGGELLIAVDQPGHGWLVTRAPWPRDGRVLIGRLIGQTLILYVVVLLPVLLAGRRISRPLRDLTSAAERFEPGEDPAPIAEQGPGDVAALIAAFNALRLRITAMLDEKDRMLGAIGHDLRTPLAALRVRIESVEDETDRARMAETIAEMNRTLDDILSLARLGRPSEPATEVDLFALVDAVVEDFRDIGYDVTLAEADRLPMRLRPSLIRRAVRNLIENAVKYAGAAEVSLARGPGPVQVIVADRGPGIPIDRIEDVFGAFTRLETSRNRETGGIGLGLALARAIVREAGGDIALANRAGGGLLATIQLPKRAGG